MNPMKNLLRFDYLTKITWKIKDFLTRWGITFEFVFEFIDDPDFMEIHFGFNLLLYSFCMSKIVKALFKFSIIFEI